MNNNICYMRFTFTKRMYLNTFFSLLFFLLSVSCTTSESSPRVGWDQLSQILENITAPTFPECDFIITDYGKIPKKWELITASEAIDIDPSIIIRKEREIKFVSMGSLSTTSMIIEPYEKRRKATGSRFQNGDTLFARITP